jgi:hypothetical protein
MGGNPPPFCVLAPIKVSALWLISFRVVALLLWCLNNRHPPLKTAKQPEGNGGLRRLNPKLLHSNNYLVQRVPPSILVLFLHEPTVDPPPEKGTHKGAPSLLWSWSTPGILTVLVPSTDGSIRVLSQVRDLYYVLTSS